QIQDPLAKIRKTAGFEKVSQQMDRMAVELGGQLDSTNQVEARRLRGAGRLVVAPKRVMVGDSEDPHAAAHRLLNQLGGRTGAVRFIRMRVQIDQSESDPSFPV